MTPEIERLLGGYATNTLTEAERKLLYEAALEDQNLFNALEDEQALRELLADEGSRREIVRALRSAPAKPSRTWIWGLAASFATAAVLAIFLIPRQVPRPELALIASSRQNVEAPPPPAPVVPKLVVPRKKAMPVQSRQIRVEVQNAGPRLQAPPAQTIAQLEAAAREDASPRARFRPMAAALAGSSNPPAPFLILRSHQDRAPTEMAPADIVPAGDSIQFKLRPSLSGSLTLSELAPDGSSKSLPPDAAIPIERQKIIRVDWVNPPSPPLITILILSPGKAPITQR